MTATALMTQLDLFAENLPEHDTQLTTYEQLGLDRRDAFGLEVHAANILNITRRSVLEIGRELLEARGKAKHGSWSLFLKRIGFEERSAENYMNVARSFGDSPEIISVLPPTALYALAAPSADPTIVQQIVSEAAAGSTFRVEDIKQRLAGTSAPQRPAPVTLQPAPRPVPLDIAATPLEQAIETQQAPAPALPPALDLTPRPTPAPAPAVEIASADDTPAAPVPAPAARPPALQIPATPAPQPAAAMPPALAIPVTPAPESDETAPLKLLTAKYHLLSAALDEVLAEMQLAGREHMPTLSIHGDVAAQAARLFLAGPAFQAAASMLALSVRVEP